MTTIPEAIVSVLDADATLTAAAPGGVHLWDDTGRNGISSDSTPDAYDADGLLLPTILVHQRSETPWGGGHDSGEQWKSLRAMVELYLYVDGGENFSDLQAAMLRTLKLLDEQFVTDAGRLKHINTYRDRDDMLNNALYIRLDVQVVLGRQLT